MAPSNAGSRPPPGEKRNEKRPSSSHLRLEADTRTEWDADVVSRLISLRVMTGDVLGQQSSARPRLPEPGERAAGARNSDAEPGKVNDLDHVVRSIVDSLPMAGLAEVIAHMLANGDDLPHDIDGKLLARCRGVLGRDLLPAERRHDESYSGRAVLSALGRQLIPLLCEYGQAHPAANRKV